MKYKSLLAAVAIMTLTAACAQNGEYGNKRVIGGLGGAALGGWAGSTIGGGTGKLAATAAGVLIGALIGSEIGRGLDQLDEQKAEQAYTQATTAPVGQTISWSNPETGNYGAVTPTREGTKQSTGEYCREFQQSVVIGGQTEDAYGVACRQPDGQWEIQ